MLVPPSIGMVGSKISPQSLHTIWLRVSLRMMFRLAQPGHSLISFTSFISFTVLLCESSLYKFFASFVGRVCVYVCLRVFF